MGRDVDSLDSRVVLTRSSNDTKSLQSSIIVGSSSSSSTSSSVKPRFPSRMV